MPGVAAVVGNSHKAFFAPQIVFDLARGVTEIASGVSQSPPSSIVPVASLLSASVEQTAPIWADDRFAHSFIEETHLSSGAQTPSQPEDSGRMRQSMHILRHPNDARSVS